MSKRPSTTDTLGIPAIRASYEEVANKVNLDGDTSLAGVMAHNRIYGKNAEKKKKDPYLAAGMLGIKNEVNNLFSSAGSATNQIENASDFLDRVKQVGVALQSASLIGALGALKAYDLFYESKHSILRKAPTDAPDSAKATKAVTPDTPDSPKAAKAVAPDAPEKSALRAAAGVTDEVAEAGTKGFFGKALGFLGAGAKLLKRVPLIGAAVTTAFVVYEVGSHVVNGRGTAALGATFAGVAEIGGNFIGFGAGDGLREGTREAFVRASSLAGYEGAFDQVHKSDIRYLVEAGMDLRQQFAEAAAPPPANRTYAPTAHYTPNFVAA